MQKVAQALIVGGLANLGLGFAIALLMGSVFRADGFDSVARVLTFSIGNIVAGVILGVGFPLTIVGIILAWVSRSEAEVGEWEDEDAKSEASQ
jgi:hypothetical protein